MDKEIIKNLIDELTTVEHIVKDIKDPVYFTVLLIKTEEFLHALNNFLTFETEVKPTQENPTVHA